MFGIGFPPAAWIVVKDENDCEFGARQDTFHFESARPCCSLKTANRQIYPAPDEFPNHTYNQWSNISHARLTVPVYGNSTTNPSNLFHFDIVAGGRNNVAFTFRGISGFLPALAHELRKIQNQTRFSSGTFWYYSRRSNVLLPTHFSRTIIVAHPVGCPCAIAPLTPSGCRHDDLRPQRLGADGVARRLHGAAAGVRHRAGAHRGRTPGTRHRSAVGSREKPVDTIAGSNTGVQICDFGLRIDLLPRFAGFN